MNKDWPPIRIFVEFVEQNQKEGMIVAELGVWKGETTTEYGPIVKKNGGRLIAIDWFEGNLDAPSYADVHAHRPDRKNTIYQTFLDNIKEAGLDDITKVYPFKTEDAHVHIDDESVDILFVDADHSRDGCRNDILNYLPKIKKGGILCGHDFYCGPVHRAVRELYDDRFIEKREDYPEPKGQLQPIWIVRNPHDSIVIDISQNGL